MIHPLIDEILKKRDGLRVIGDVHGHIEPFREAVKHAMAMNLGVLQLGDLIDRGPASVETMRFACDMVRFGTGLFIVGNHDAKFLRHAKGNPVKISSGGLDETLAQVETHSQGAAIAAEYVETTSRMPVWIAAGRYLFVHAGFLPEMLHRSGPQLGLARWRDSAIQRALYGETDGSFGADGHPTRTYRWADMIPGGVKVVIGHDVHSTSKIVTRTGALGGEIHHVDTGMGSEPGGKLSWIDISKTELEAPRFHYPRPSEPLLTLLVGPSGAGKSRWAAGNADPEAIISTDAIRAELSGDFRSQEQNVQVFRLAHERLQKRLSAGLPAVLDATNLRRQDRLAALALAPADHPVRYVVIDRPLDEKRRDGGWRLEAGNLLERHHDMFRSQIGAILAGDERDNVEILDLRSNADTELRQTA